MKNIITYLFLFFALVAVVPACTDKFEEYNTDKSQLMEVGTKELAAMFSRSQVQGSSWLTTDNYSRMSSTVANHFCGYTACGITNQETNIMRTGWHNTGFNIIYSSAYPPLKSVMDVAGSGSPAYHVALIWKVFLMHRMTDLWGPVPYTDAGSGNESVAYESQQEVYDLMFEDLAVATAALTEELGKNPDLNVFAAGDMIYQGQVSKWIKFGNTLRLRLAVRISNVDPAKAKTEAEAAVKGSLLETNDDDALLSVTKLNSSGNGIPRMESFYQDVMSASMESVLKGYQDPRMEEFFSPVEYNSVIEAAGYPEELKANVGGYHGMANGFYPDYVNYYRSFSTYGSRFADGNQYITPINIMHAAEAYFLKAEGAWRGWSMGGDAQSFYEKGIEISIKQWKGTTYSQTVIANYINSTATPMAPDNYPYNDPAMTDIPVKFSTDRDKQFEQIMTQKWLALWPISFEAWAEYRRTRLPKIYAKKYSANDNVSVSSGKIVTRLPYTDDEKAAQPGEIEKAIELLGGPDLETTPLWWDVNSNGN
jgi:hypothetical protein